MLCYKYVVKYSSIGLIPLYRGVSTTDFRNAFLPLYYYRPLLPTIRTILMKNYNTYDPHEKGLKVKRMFYTIPISAWRWTTDSFVQTRLTE